MRDIANGVISAPKDMVAAVTMVRTIGLCGGGRVAHWLCSDGWQRRKTVSFVRETGGTRRQVMSRN